jgi:hypothetical protein
MKEKWTEYKGYTIQATQTTSWIIHKIEDDKKEFVLMDSRTIDGEWLQSIEQAINDAKKNIDALERLKL